MSHSQPSLDLSKDRISPEKVKASRETSPVSPGEEGSTDQRGMPATDSIIHEEETTERESPAASPPDPAVSQGTLTMLLFQQRTVNSGRSCDVVG